MSQSLLMEAQSLRLEGDIDGSIALLRVVISQCDADVDNDGTAAEKHRMTHELWQMASYQLSLLLLQKSGRCSDQASEREADNTLVKMGYRLRLSTKAFGYPACECAAAITNDDAKLPLLMIDDILPQSIFHALQHSLRPSSRYWTDFYSKTSEGEGRSNEAGDKRRIFASHNISLPNSTDLTSSECIEKASSLIEQVAIIVKHCLSHHFPLLATATSVEVWSHRRTPDAQHQLHYDMDEISLHEHKQRHKEGCNSAMNKRQKVGHCSEERSKRNQAKDYMSSMIKDLCPIISCVLTVNVPYETKTCDRCGRLGDGAPTLVCNQSLLGSSCDEGWLCYPRQNRLVAFDGSLLHAVVPGIPSEALSKDEDLNSRVTFMMGFWKDVRLTVPDKTSECLTIGPNVPFPSSLLDEFKPIAVDESSLSMHMLAASKHVQHPILVSPLWTELSNEQAGNSNEFASAGEQDFSGRFFLRSTDPTEIDDIVLGL
jgi:hypothetical protein